MLGLHCCTQPSSICSTQAYCSGFSCCGAPTLGLCASVVGIQGLINCGLQAIECTGFSSCGTWAQLFCALWNLPRPGIEPVSPALAGRFLSIVPLGKMQLLNALGNQKNPCDLLYHSALKLNSKYLRGMPVLRVGEDCVLQAQLWAGSTVRQANEGTDFYSLQPQNHVTFTKIS